MRKATWVVLRYDMCLLHTSAGQSAPPPRVNVLHRARTQHLTLGCACSRQTKLLAHGYPSAIWGGRNPVLFIGLRLGERLPEIDMRPAPCACPPAPAMASQRHGALQPGAVMDAAAPIRRHRWLRSRPQRRLQATEIAAISS